MNASEILDRMLTHWDEAGPFYHHLVLLTEWNETTNFSPTNTCMMQTQLGTMVIQDIQQQERQFDEAGQLTGLGESTYCQLCAVYGDDEELFRLVVFNNGAPHALANTEILVNNGPMRS